jgi:hypothetical protein
MQHTDNGRGNRTNRTAPWWYIKQSRAASVRKKERKKERIFISQPQRDRYYMIYSEHSKQVVASENLSASPFNKELLNETIFSLIHFTGQYL